MIFVRNYYNNYLGHPLSEVYLHTFQELDLLPSSDEYYCHKNDRFFFIFYLTVVCCDRTAAEW